MSLLRDHFKVEATSLPAGSPETGGEISKVWAAKPRSKSFELQCEVVMQSPPLAKLTPPMVERRRYHDDWQKVDLVEGEIVIEPISVRTFPDEMDRTLPKDWIWIEMQNIRIVACC